MAKPKPKVPLNFPENFPSVKFLRPNPVDPVRVYDEVPDLYEQRLEDRLRDITSTEDLLEDPLWLAQDKFWRRLHRRARPAKKKRNR